MIPRESDFICDALFVMLDEVRNDASVAASSEAGMMGHRLMHRDDGASSQASCIQMTA